MREGKKNTVNIIDIFDDNAQITAANCFLHNRSVVELEAVDATLAASHLRLGNVFQIGTQGGFPAL